jgi:methionine biosynthesis protein MetW
VKKDEFYEKGYYAGPTLEPRFYKVLEVFDELKGELLLDIGCGDGTFTALLKESSKVKEAFGIEIASGAISAIEKKGIKACQLDIDQNPFPFADKYFDLIYCGEVIEHLFNPDHLLREIYRVLKLEGTCVISTPNLAGWPNRLALFLGYQPFSTSVSPEHESVGKILVKGDEGQWGHIRVFTLRAFLELLKLNHFKIKQIIGCPVTVNTFPSKGFTRLIGEFDKAVSNIPSLACRTIVVIRKQ